MAGLLLLTGALVLLSGGIKLRAGRRVDLPVQPLSLLEVFVGLALCLLAMAGPAAAGAARLMVPMGVVLVIVSSLLFSARHREAQRRRALTEAKRLEAFVKYFSRVDDIEGDAHG
jgi:hypothetical protein